MASISNLGPGKYRITVYIGTKDGRKKRKRITWTAPVGMTQRQADKAVILEADRYEKDIKSSLGKFYGITLEEFSKIWLEEYAKKQLKESTISRYERMMDRINDSLGDIVLTEIVAVQLLEFYKELGEAGVKDCKKKQLVGDIDKALKRKGWSNAELIRQAGIAGSTYQVMKKGESVSVETAEKVVRALGSHMNKLFMDVNAEEKLSSTTIHRYHELISSMLQTAVNWQILPFNPASRIKPPRVIKPEIKALTDEEVKRMLTALESEDQAFKTMVYLLLFTGMRRGELFGLEWKDIDYKNQTVFIRRNSVYVPGQGILTTTPKTKTSVRVEKVPSYIIDLLKDHEHNQKIRKMEMGSEWKNRIFLGDGRWCENDRVFTQPDGDIANPQGLSSKFKDFMNKIELPDVHLHCLRHTNASMLISAGVDVRTVAGRLGHANPSTTLNIYSHFYQAMDNGAADVLEDILNKYDTTPAKQVQFRDLRVVSGS